MNKIFKVLAVLAFVISVFNAVSISQLDKKYSLKNEKPFIDDLFQPRTSQ